MVVGSSVPLPTNRDYWALQLRLLPHAERCLWWMGEICRAEYDFNDIIATHAMHMLGVLYTIHGRLKEAEAMFQRALEGCEKALGLDHASTL
jgi:Tetratricopeptide repeat